LAGQLTAKSIETLIIIGGNPAYDAPRELKFAELIAGVKNSLHLSIYKNETSLACKWVVNLAHPLESWKDGIASDGSLLIGQPLINPIFGGKSDIEALAVLLGEKVTDGQTLVRSTSGLSDEKAWREAVHYGFVAQSAAQTTEVKAGEAPKLESSDAWSKPWDGSSLELVFNTSLSTYDGQFANNGWMLELPNFLSKIVWDNVASVNPRTASKLGLAQGTLVTLKVGGEEIKLPVNIQPGQADGSIGVEIGWGRTAAGRVGGDKLAGISSVGHDVGSLRKISGWSVTKLNASDVVGSSSKFKLALIQEPWTIDKTGGDEIQARMFRDKNKASGDRSSLLREGSLASYLEFLERHPLDHGDEHPKGHSSNELPVQPEFQQALGKSGQLPILGQVSYRDDQGDHHDEHHHWPEAFHMHHELFDITKGVREEYKESNPENKNVWGKTIDLNKCIGCNACVIACQSENNIPVVGKNEAWRGREMHWIRIDRYYGDNLYTDDAEDDDEILVHQPMACHHCENAPCETVCPVAATVHSSEGLNDMVYNRCIGTRYCGNNCPFKVRRFNYMNYSDAQTFIKYPKADKLPAGDLAFQGLMMNPEVTVRSRGVMEKCTYCVQRIQNVKITAKNERRDIGPNEITTACQDACPTSAIEFGDLNNKASRVAQKKASPRAYVMLEELNILPRTKYLARVRNVHPALLARDDRDSVRKTKATKKVT
jgi:molybdopterin-containing oxidoreductase family iron-sulfur binding subunit